MSGPSGSCVKGILEPGIIRNIIWVDICSKVIPGTKRKALDQNAAGSNKRKRLMSPDAKSQSQNTGGSKSAENQAGWGDTRVYFFVALTRGVLGVTVFTDVQAFPGETQAGAALCVQRLPQLLNKMLGSNTQKPRTVLCDRGPGFYHPRVGVITSDFDAAIKSTGFKLWAGTNSCEGPHRQPGDVADVLDMELSTKLNYSSNASI